MTMKRLLLLTLLITSPLLAQPRGEWVSYPAQGCIGGSQCSERRLRIPLEDRPVIAVRFTAHDQIGASAGGELRVKIGSETVGDDIDIPRSGETFTLDVDSLRGTHLTFEPASDDEVDVRNIQVMYGRGVETRRSGGRSDGWLGSDRDDRGGRIDRDDRDRGSWRSYSEAGCIGGDECRRNGTRVTIPLQDAPVIGVRFYAHDNHGVKSDGKLNVRIGSTSIASYVDVQRDGKRHEFDVDSVRGTTLVISTATDDEVTIRDVQVLYGRASQGPRGGGSGSSGGWNRETKHEGGCIGGSECGGRRARIRVRLREMPVSSIRFYAADNIGTRASGKLRVSIDDEVLRDYIDIPREGRTFTIDGKQLEGEWLLIELAEDDEVKVRDIIVTYGN